MTGMPWRVFNNSGQWCTILILESESILEWFHFWLESESYICKTHGIGIRIRDFGTGIGIRIRHFHSIPSLKLLGPISSVLCNDMGMQSPRKLTFISIFKGMLAFKNEATWSCGEPPPANDCNLPCTLLTDKVLAISHVSDFLSSLNLGTVNDFLSGDFLCYLNLGPVTAAAA